MSFNESNTVEQMILDTLALRHSTEPFDLREEAPGWGSSLGKNLAAAAPRPPKWTYVPAADLPRQPRRSSTRPLNASAGVRSSSTPNTDAFQRRSHTGKINP